MKPEGYEEIWQAFITGNHISQGSIWGGEGIALVLPVAAPEVLACIVAIQQRLSTALPFAPHLPETLHITLYLFGSPPPEDLPILTAFVRSALAEFPAFPIHFRRVNSFFRAPFLEVEDPEPLNRLLACLQPGLTALGYPGAAYGPRVQVWHVTLGGYTKSNNGAAARKLVSELRGQTAGSMVVEEVQLVQTSAGAPFRIKILASMPLRSAS